MKHKLITLGTLSVSALPLITLVSCGSEPLKLEPTIPAKGNFSYHEAFALTDEASKPVATLLKNYNDTLQEQIDQKTTEYFFAVADIVADINNDKIGDVAAITKMLEAFYNYTFFFANTSLTIDLTFAGQENETLTNDYNLLVKLDMEDQILENVNVENVATLLSVFKRNLIDFDNFQEDQYESIKASPLMKAYADNYTDTNDGKGLLLYDFSNLEDTVSMPAYKIYWSTSKTQANNILDKLNSNFRIY